MRRDAGAFRLVWALLSERQIVVWRALGSGEGFCGRCGLGSGERGRIGCLGSRVGECLGGGDKAGGGLPGLLAGSFTTPELAAEGVGVWFGGGRIST